MDASPASPEIDFTGGRNETTISLPGPDNHYENPRANTGNVENGANIVEARNKPKAENLKSINLRVRYMGVVSVKKEPTIEEDVEVSYSLRSLLEQCDFEKTSTSCKQGRVLKSPTTLAKSLSADKDNTAAGKPKKRLESVVKLLKSSKQVKDQNIKQAHLPAVVTISSPSKKMSAAPLTATPPINSNVISTQFSGPIDSTVPRIVDVRSLAAVPHEKPLNIAADTSFNNLPSSSPVMQVENGSGTLPSTGKQAVTAIPSSAVSVQDSSVKLQGLPGSVPLTIKFVVPNSLPFNRDHFQKILQASLASIATPARPINPNQLQEAVQLSINAVTNSAVNVQVSASKHQPIQFSLSNKTTPASPSQLAPAKVSQPRLFPVIAPKIVTTLELGNKPLEGASSCATQTTGVIRKKGISTAASKVPVVSPAIKPAAPIATPQVSMRPLHGGSAVHTKPASSFQDNSVQLSAAPTLKTAPSVIELLSKALENPVASRNCDSNHQSLAASSDVTASPSLTSESASLLKDVAESAVLSDSQQSNNQGMTLSSPPSTGSTPSSVTAVTIEKVVSSAASGMATQALVSSPSFVSNSQSGSIIVNRSSLSSSQQDSAVLSSASAPIISTTNNQNSPNSLESDQSSPNDLVLVYPTVHSDQVRQTVVHLGRTSSTTNMVQSSPAVGSSNDLTTLPRIKNNPVSPIILDPSNPNQVSQRSQMLPISNKVYLPAVQSSSTVAAGTGTEAGTVHSRQVARPIYTSITYPILQGKDRILNQVQSGPNTPGEAGANREDQMLPASYDDSEWEIAYARGPDGRYSCKYQSCQKSYKSKSGIRKHYYFYPSHHGSKVPLETAAFSCDTFLPPELTRAQRKARLRELFKRLSEEEMKELALPQMAQTVSLVELLEEKSMRLGRSRTISTYKMFNEFERFRKEVEDKLTQLIHVAQVEKAKNNSKGVSSESAGEPSQPWKEIEGTMADTQTSEPITSTPVNSTGFAVAPAELEKSNSESNKLPSETADCSVVSIETLNTECTVTSSINSPSDEVESSPGHHQNEISSDPVLITGSNTKGDQEHSDTNMSPSPPDDKDDFAVNDSTPDYIISSIDSVDCQRHQEVTRSSLDKSNLGLFISETRGDVEEQEIDDMDSNTVKKQKELTKCDNQEEKKELTVVNLGTQTTVESVEEEMEPPTIIIDDESESMETDSQLEDTNQVDKEDETAISGKGQTETAIHSYSGRAGGNTKDPEKLLGVHGESENSSPEQKERKNPAVKDEETEIEAENIDKSDKVLTKTDSEEHAASRMEDGGTPEERHREDLNQVVNSTTTDISMNESDRQGHWLPTNDCGNTAEEDFRHLEHASAKSQVQGPSEIGSLTVKEPNPASSDATEDSNDVNDNLCLSIPFMLKRGKVVRRMRENQEKKLRMGAKEAFRNYIIHHPKGAASVVLEAKTHDMKSFFQHYVMPAFAERNSSFLATFGWKLLGKLFLSRREYERILRLDLGPEIASVLGINIFPTYKRMMDNLVDKQKGEKDTGTLDKGEKHGTEMLEEMANSDGQVEGVTEAFKLSEMRKRRRLSRTPNRKEKVIKTSTSVDAKTLETRTDKATAVVNPPSSTGCSSSSGVTSAVSEPGSCPLVITSPTPRVVVATQTSSSLVSPQTLGPAVAPSTSSPAVTPQTSSLAVTPQLSSSAVIPQTSNPAVTPHTSSPAVTPSTSSPAVTPRTSGPVVVPQTPSPAVAPQKFSSVIVPAQAKIYTSAGSMAHGVPLPSAKGAPLFLIPVEKVSPEILEQFIKSGQEISRAPKGQSSPAVLVLVPPASGSGTPTIETLTSVSQLEANGGKKPLLLIPSEKVPSSVVGQSQTVRRKMIITMVATSVNTTGSNTNPIQSPSSMTGDSKGSNDSSAGSAQGDPTSVTQSMQTPVMSPGIENPPTQTPASLPVESVVKSTAAVSATCTDTSKTTADSDRRKTFVTADEKNLASVVLTSSAVGSSHVSRPACRNTSDDVSRKPSIRTIRRSRRKAGSKSNPTAHSDSSTSEDSDDNVSGHEYELRRTSSSASGTTRLSEPISDGSPPRKRRKGPTLKGPTLRSSFKATFVADKVASDRVLRSSPSKGSVRKK